MLAAALPAPRSPPPAYARHRPETTTLYDAVRDNLDTLYGTIDDAPELSAVIPTGCRLDRGSSES